MTTERRASTPGSSTLPESQGLPAEFTGARDAYYFYKQALRGTERVVFDAQLPHIVGYIPPEERDFFSTYPTIGTPKTFYGRFPTDSDGFQALQAGMPGVYSQITDDIARWNIPRLALDELVLDRKVTHEGIRSGVDMDYHTDSLEPFYIVVDNNGPEFYAGPAELQPPMRGIVLLDRSSLDGAVVPVQAPDFAIIRMTPLTVHRKIVFPQDALRTRGMAFTARK